MSYEYELETDGDLRVRVILDESPSEPENDGGCPVIRVDSDGWGGARFDHTGYGKYYDAGFDPVAALAHFEERWGWRQAVEAFERYVRIFHEGSVETYNLGISREYGYVAFTTRTLTRAWGNADDQPVPEAELNEWQAYVEGDVYGWVVERRETEHHVITDLDGKLLREFDCSVWSEVEACWGYYGNEYAEEEARATFEWWVKHPTADKD